MAQTYPKTFKNCSTCDSWEGKRDVSSDGSVYTVDSPSSKGSCKHQEGKEKFAFMTCAKWA